MLINNDCIEVLRQLDTNSVDLIILDPPFGTTPLEWDICIDFKVLWKELKRVRKPSAATLIFGQEPFSSHVRLSNLEEYKYDWIWQKERLTNVFQVKNRPGKVVENISVFYQDQPTYNPQKTIHTGKKVSNKIKDSTKWSTTMAGKTAKSKPVEYIDDGFRHPIQVLNQFRREHKKQIHPTQKPVSLYEYIIKTYSNEGDLILDCFLGSGSSAIAARNLGRNFIGVEKDFKIFNKAYSRYNLVTTITTTK